MTCDRCQEVGEATCADERAAFAREPRLPPGFELGAQWTSFDDGLTWVRFPTVEQAREMVDRRGHIARMTIEAIDQKTGTVTLRVG